MPPQPGTAAGREGRLDHGDRDVHAGQFPTLRASDVDGAGAGDEYASLIHAYPIVTLRLLT